ncbi:unnamed protein product [Bursaphelenchus xylophilus]|uniref:(pine wood nematode) hypothetical protein n=1 Tax=Bursaphelenchus xylophilus TaxID=6326 RepID=A0A1I7S3C3_BURXY|nr:unnamed protein product [Bursaphelenchus xylophilus]CAG9116208.1 unnamed protein product [Bursaphelenchus xylophilus]
MFRTLAVILFMASVAVALCCPLFRRTRKGIIYIHFCLIQAFHVWFNADEHLVGYNYSNILLCAAAIPIFIEHSLTMNQACKEIELHEAFMVTVSLVLFDWFSKLAFETSRFTSIYIYTTGLACLVYFYVNLEMKPWKDANLDELASIEHDSLFIDFRNRLNMTGRGGDLRLVQIFGRLALGLVPYFGGFVWIRYLFVLSDCVSIVGIMFSPPIVGGMVQVMKMLGRFIVERQLQKRIKEALKKYKRRGAQSPSRELLLANVEEEFNDESGFVTTEFV